MWAEDQAASRLWHLMLTALQVEGPLDYGVVNVHLVKRPGQDEFEYKYLALDVKGGPMHSF